MFTLCLIMLTRSAQFYEKIFGFRVISYFAPRGCAMGADTAKYWPGNMACASSSSISGESITRRGNRPLPSRARTKEAIRDGENVLVVVDLLAKGRAAVTCSQLVARPVVSLLRYGADPS